MEPPHHLDFGGDGVLIAHCGEARHRLLAALAFDPAGDARRDDLEHAAAAVLHRLRHREELVLRSGGTRQDAPVRTTVHSNARGAKANRARLDRLFHDPRHLGEILPRRPFVGFGATAQHISPHGAMRDVRGDVDRVLSAIKEIEVVGVALPTPRDADVERRAGNVLDPFGDCDQPVLAALAHGRKTNPATAEHDGSDAMSGGRQQVAVPRDLPVVMSVNVDKARGEQLTGDVDRLARRAVDLRLDSSNAPVSNCDIGRERCAASSIEHHGVLKQQIVHRALLVWLGFQAFRALAHPELHPVSWTPS